LKAKGIQVQTLPNKSTRIGIFAGLCWLYACIHMDRQILAILAESVKSDLGISDSSLGALTGSAFSIVYALLGLYFGRMADMADRLALVRIGAWVWSLASIGAAFAPGYALLVAARGGVAAGEAIATAASVSLMAELAGDRYRARASSLFFAAAFLGAGLAAIMGGAVINYFRDSSGVVGWRAALVVAGLPGMVGAVYLSCYRWRDLRPRSARPGGAHAVTAMLLAASLLAVFVQMRWPANLGVPAAVLIAAGAAGFWGYRLRRDDAAAFRATLGRDTFRWLLIGFAPVLFLDYAASFWLIPFAQRQYGLSAAAAGARLGGLMIAGGIAGSLMGGWFADRWRRKAAAGRVWTALIAVLIEAAAILAAIAQTDYRLFLVAFSVFCLASGGWTGVAAAIGLDMVPRAHRATGVAAYFLVTTVLGPGLGAFVAGLLGDALGSMGRSLAACCAVAIITVWAFLRLGRALGAGSASSEAPRE
jgi:MFS family permease